MKTILVTGSNGFIGKYIKEYNDLKEYKILYGTTSPIQNDNSYIKFDSLYSDMKIILKDQKIDVIIHCASIIPDSFDSSNTTLFFENIKMMTNLYEFSIEQKIKKFIYTSSFGSIQNIQKYDIKDYYTLSKITGEHMCAMMENNGIQTASLRISSPFGEFYRKTNVLSLFIDSAIENKTLNIYGSGKREQNFVYVGNILKFIKCCIKYDVSGVYDVVSQTNISMKELAETIIKLSNSKSAIKLGENEDPLEGMELPNYSFEKAKEVDYKDEYDFEDALRKYIEYRRKLLKK